MKTSSSKNTFPLKKIFAPKNLFPKEIFVKAMGVSHRSKRTHFDRIGQRDHNSERQSLWYGDDDDSDTDDDEADKILNVVVVPGKLMNDEPINTESQNQSDQSGQRSSQT